METVEGRDEMVGNEEAACSGARSVYCITRGTSIGIGARDVGVVTCSTLCVAGKRGEGDVERGAWSVGLVTGPVGRHMRSGRPRWREEAGRRRGWPVERGSLQKRNERRKGELKIM